MLAKTTSGRKGLLWFLMARKEKQPEFGMVCHVASTTRKQKKMTACFCSVPFFQLHSLGSQPGNDATCSGQVFPVQLTQPK